MSWKKFLLIGLAVGAFAFAAAPQAEAGVAVGIRFGFPGGYGCYGYGYGYPAYYPYGYRYYGARRVVYGRPRYHYRHHPRGAHYRQYRYARHRNWR